MLRIAVAAAVVPNPFMRCARNVMVGSTAPAPQTGAEQPDQRRACHSANSARHADMRYFEDLEVGSVSSFGSYTVTRDEVLAFAEKFDPQPFHLSDEAAAKTHFGRLAASGWHTCAMTMAMLVDHMKDSEQASRGAAGVDELRWLKPVYPGDTLRCEVELLDKRESQKRPDIGRTSSRMTVFNQNDEPVLSYIARAMVARRPAN